MKWMCNKLSSRGEASTKKKSMSHEWQGPLRPGEKPSVESLTERADEKPEDKKSEDIENVEKDLSPEVIEMIMDKVQDLDREGTAYSRIDEYSLNDIEGDIEIKRQKEIVDPLMAASNNGEISVKEAEKRLQQSRQESIKEVERQKVVRWKKFLQVILDTFVDGVIGVSYEDSQKIKKDERKIKEKYIKRIKNKKNSDNLVHANIVGRNEKYADVYRNDFSHKSNIDIGNSYYIRRSDFVSAIIFDKEFFKETEPKEKLSERSLGKDKWSFNANDPGVIEAYEKASSARSEIKIGDEILKNYGQTNSPIGGRAFDQNGLPRPWEEYGFVFFPRVPKRALRGLVVKIPEEEKKYNQLKELENKIVETFKQKNGVLIPIYNQEGYLLWPKQMSYEEVKKFVAERDAKKKEKLDSGSSPE
jgi:hypothetical protein